MKTCISLKGRRVTLEPLEDLEYLVDLTEENNKYQYTRQQAKDLIHNYDGEFWTIYLDNSKRGIVGYFKINDVYILESLKDKSQPSTGISYSIEVGNLILDYLFELTTEVSTFTRIEDKSVQILCKKLGFKETDRVVESGKEFILYKKRR